MTRRAARGESLLFLARQQSQQTFAGQRLGTAAAEFLVTEDDRPAAAGVTREAVPSLCCYWRSTSNLLEAGYGVLVYNQKSLSPQGKHFTVGVLCSESAGLSNAIIEYMGCGKPTICTNAGGNPELIIDGYSGFLVDAGDINTMADRIITVLCNPSLALEMGKNALKIAEDNFSMQKNVSSYTHLYEQLIHGENN